MKKKIKQRMFQTTSHHIVAASMVRPETDEDRNKCPPSNSQLLQLPHTHSHAVNPEEMQDEKAQDAGPRYPHQRNDFGESGLICPYIEKHYIP